MAHSTCTTFWPRGCACTEAKSRQPQSSPRIVAGARDQFAYLDLSTPKPENQYIRQLTSTPSRSTPALPYLGSHITRSATEFRSHSTVLYKRATSFLNSHTSCGGVIPLQPNNNSDLKTNCKTPLLLRIDPTAVVKQRPLIAIAIDIVNRGMLFPAQRGTVRTCCTTSTPAAVPYLMDAMLLCFERNFKFLSVPVFNKQH